MKLIHSYLTAYVAVWGKSGKDESKVWICQYVKCLYVVSMQSNSI